MYNNQRLVPFLGGLAIGGLSGVAFNNNGNKYPYYQYPQYYPNYQYQYPMQYSYPVYDNYYLKNQMPPVGFNNNIYDNSMLANKIIDEQPFLISYTTDTRSIQDLKNVPLYNPY